MLRRTFSAALLATAMQQGRNVYTFIDNQCADANRPANFMAGDRHRMHAQSAHVDVDFAKGLHGIGMQ